MAIKNVSTVYDEKVNIKRAAIEHRATWMGLTYEEMVQAGADAEAMTRAAIHKTGEIQGAGIKAACKEPADLTQFAANFLDDVTKTTFQMDIVESTEDDLKIEFHYCPLLSAWKKLGFSDEECAKLCDMAMDGDRGIAKAMGITLDLTDTIAQGCEVCKLHFHK
ncbi:MAG: L-2-amino-thiazoline-4-carboxylic acid hydrolase [Intestinimonas sp.]|nr:L-2-amino-thiazoline-4-carboxylic acid hydrolase [Intestinimonas sp.]